MQNIAGLLAAMYITWLLLFQQSAPPPPSRPTTLDLKDFGVAALHRWLDAAEVPTKSWQQSWFDLDDGTLPPDGNLLLTTLPHDVHAANGEVDALLEWVRQGNTLIINAALNDTPSWILSHNNEMLEEFETLTGVPVSEVEQEEHAGNTPETLASGATLVLDPVAGHPLMTGVDELVFFTDTSTEFWLPDLSDKTPLLLQAATERSTRAPGIWEITRGKGHIIVLASSSLFSNQALQNEGNAQLVRNLVGLRLQGQGQGRGQEQEQEQGVWLFDDYRLGIGAYVDPSRFYRDERLWHSIGFLLAGWLIYLLTTDGRLTKPRPADSRPRLGDHIRAMGGLLARKLDKVTFGRQMLAAWEKEQRAANSDAIDPWSRLESHPTFDQGLLAALKRDASVLAAGKPVALRELHNNLRKARQSFR